MRAVEQFMEHYDNDLIVSTGIGMPKRAFCIRSQIILFGSVKISFGPGKKLCTVI